MPNSDDFHPDLARGRFIPRFSFGERSSRLMRSLRPRPMAPGAGVEIREIVVTGPTGAPDVSMRVFAPSALMNDAPALLWLHGGGLVLGAPEQDDATNSAFARELGITVAAVRYRLAPQHPAPAALEDAYAGLLGLVARAGDLHVAPDRIAIGGASAGGGIAAALALLAHDRGEVRPAFQLLVYPMLDDRTVTRGGPAPRNARMWTPKSNRFAWTAYLGSAVGGPEVSPYAAAARRTDLTGLPPAWIGVGSLDLFHDEDVDYANRLRAAGVDCELLVIPGAFHGFDAVFRNAGVTRDFHQRQRQALGAALGRPQGRC